LCCHPTSYVEQRFQSTTMTLATAPIGQVVVLVTLPQLPSLHDRLRAMGLRPGSEVQVLRRGFPGGLLHVRCGQLEFMLRRSDAAEMAIRPLAA
jgi:ferrous iron transport protein A